MLVSELLKYRDIKYIQKGADYVVKCLNPDHTDSTPSMRIDKVTGIFNCFSCPFKGNIFAHFGEAPNKLQLKRDLLRKRLREKAAENIGLILPAGCVPYTGDWRNISSETYEKFEAFQHHSNDHIGRIVFPIRNISGRIVAFIGRHTSGGTPKYIISPPNAKMPVFPVVKAIKGRIILVEGIYDMINLHDKGLTNAVCTFGTKQFNEDKLQMLMIQGVDGVDIFFDGDTAGQGAAADIKMLCEKLSISSRNVNLPNKDPGELSREHINKLKDKLYRE